MLDSSLTTTHILAAFDPDIGGLPGGAPWPNEPRSPRDPMMLASLRADFEALYAERYSVTGQADAAMKQAIERLRFKWGATDVGSESSLTAYPPEHYYPMVDGSHDWMDDQLTDYKDANEPDAQQWFLIPTEETERAVSASQPVPYAIGIIDKDGVFRVLSREDSARPRQFIFNYDEAREAAHERFEQDRRIATEGYPEGVEGMKQFLEDYGPDALNRYMQSGKSLGDFIKDELGGGTLGRVLTPPALPWEGQPGPGPTLDPGDAGGGGMTGSGPTLP